MRAVLENVTKVYGEMTVLRNLNLTLEGVNVLMAPSGQGKTTLARILLGLEKPDSGSVKVSGRIAAQFQEDRLCSQLTALENVLLVCGKDEKVRAEQALRNVGFTQKDMDRLADRLSGGQARRVALVRALLAPSDGVILDEPFKGLDEHTKCKTIQWTKKMLKDKWLLLITHDECEAQAFEGIIRNDLI